MSNNEIIFGNEEGVNYLAPWTYSCLIKTSIDRLKTALSENREAIHALNHLQELFRQIDRASPSFLYDFSKLLLIESGVTGTNVQESYLRMHANAATDELELPQFAHIAEFQYLSLRAVSLCKVLARIPDEMTDRRPFLETIKEIASSIKQLLDTTNAIIALVPRCYQPLVEKRKREFVQVSKRFSSTLKDYFKHQEPNQVFVAANHLIWQTMKLCMSIRDRIHLA
ncbi:hypothetical protein niasHT_007319 [Heterodera trifolii]|uniref:Programmed cell death protein 10 n=1 Tax=Heterodera trifolii TaxID=157864 RepID=A0ABD2LNX3_9BILA